MVIQDTRDDRVIRDLVGTRDGLDIPATNQERAVSVVNQAIADSLGFPATLDFQGLTAPQPPLAILVFPDTQALLDSQASARQVLVDSLVIQGTQGSVATQVSAGTRDLPESRAIQDSQEPHSLH